MYFLNTRPVAILFVCLTIGINILLKHWLKYLQGILLFTHLLSYTTIIIKQKPPLKH